MEKKMTLNELLDEARDPLNSLDQLGLLLRDFAKLGAAVSASPQPPLGCPECGGTDLRWSNGRTVIFCYQGKPYPEHSFDVSTLESFRKFFAPAPAQDSEK